jgi:hypothetical protein
MRWKGLSALIVWIWLAACPGAANAQQTATMMGAGLVSCGAWVEVRKGAPNKVPLEEWALGYLSGVAMWTANSPLNGLDPGAVVVWLDNYCQSRPLEPFKLALDAFIRARAQPPAPAAPAAPSGGTRPR